MADKTTTLKTKTNDNVYPKVIGESRKDAFSDSSTITHHFYDQTHKVGFQIANETNIKIQNSLQKPAGLTKTKLVGVGANGQENIEIGDNLTLANGKLSATGGGSGGDAFDVLISSEDGQTYTGTISGTKPVLITSNGNGVLCTQYSNNLANTYFIVIDEYATIIGKESLSNGKISGSFTYIQRQLYSHFISMTNSTDNIALYLTIQNTSETEFTADTLASYLANNKVLANGNLHGVVPTHIAGIGASIYVYYMTPGDNNINQNPDVFGDLSSFDISDLVSPVK